jgi:5'-nucleotidase/UDP-sugar diphosphatase
MRLFILTLLFAVVLPVFGRTRIVLLHFSDYHSHALPFYSEGRPDQGGIARAIGAMKRARQADDAIVLSGGDMINKGSPAWSDKYRCAEWPWLNGVVDAMALGNHDFDYGVDVFNDCRAQLKYPIVSANTAGFPASTVIERKGVRVGVFAVAGSDFASLTKGMTFTDRVAAARRTVADLRRRADVVVMIGHEYKADDYEIARAVPGIDVIFGTHGHLKLELTLIPETNTWFISPGQYLTYITRVTITLDHRKRGESHALHVEGELIPIDSHLRADPVIAERVAKMQLELERDPEYAPLFEPIGKLAKAVSVDDLGARTVSLMRDAVHADVAISTASSFRQPLPPGTITVEALRAAMPYDNEIVVGSMTSEQLQRLLSFSGEALFATLHPRDVDPARTYRVATTEYLANVSVYKQFFSGVEKSGLRVRDQVRQWITTNPSP